MEVMQFAKDGPENRVCSSHLHFRSESWAPLNTTPSSLYWGEWTLFPGLRTLQKRMSPSVRGWWFIKAFHVTQPLLTCHAILLVKYWLHYYSPGKNESQTDPIHLSYSLTVGPKTLFRDTLVQVIPESDSWSATQGHCLKIYQISSSD